MVFRVVVFFTAGFGFAVVVLVLIGVAVVAMMMLVLARMAVVAVMVFVLVAVTVVAVVMIVLAGMTVLAMVVVVESLVVFGAARGLDGTGDGQQATGHDRDGGQMGSDDVDGILHQLFLCGDHGHLGEISGKAGPEDSEIPT